MPARPLIQHTTVFYGQQPERAALRGHFHLLKTGVQDMWDQTAFLRCLLLYTQVIKVSRLEQAFNLQRASGNIFSPSAAHNTDLHRIETRGSDISGIYKINLTEDFKILFLMQTYKEECSNLSIFPGLIQHFLKPYNEYSSFKAVLSTKIFL